MYLLDTNVVSALRKVRAGKSDRGVAGGPPRHPLRSCSSPRSPLHELELGVLVAERSDSRKGALLRVRLDVKVVAAIAERVLPVDDMVARRAARLHVPDPAAFRDALIGATALEHHMAVVTRNTNDFVRFTGLDPSTPGPETERSPGTAGPGQRPLRQTGLGRPL